jgi:hypothetical protein
MLDVIITGTVRTFCCMACEAGFYYGIQSGNKVCKYHSEKWHKILFIDNNYKDYDHQKHLDYIIEYKPKYATTRDLMTKEQCESLGITYYDFDTVMVMAEEIEKYADNVIIIPKYDCLDDIPERYVLGYSVPTSHGGTPLPIEMFSGRRIHLLGGSWKNQLTHYEKVKDDVVSIDHNYISSISRYGTFVLSDGKQNDFTKNGIVLKRPMISAFAVSLDSMMQKVKELNENR